jgi:uncharacterized protein with ParB-like and HNH nuclease domain
METLLLQNLFANKVFKIPNYQRGYSWETEQINDLIEDLELISNKIHYTGTIVWKKSNETVKGFGETFPIHEIVDGQQRLTSLIIFLNEIRKELDSINSNEAKKTAKTILETYIKKEGTQGAIYKLELDGDNAIYFREAVLEPDGFAEQKTKSHSLLQNAKTTFREYLLSKKRAMKENEYYVFLQNLVSKITQYLGFTVYEVEDDSEVGVIFEVLNDRGKPLSRLDIVKNFLIYETEKISGDNNQSKKQLTAKINYGWKEILENLALAGMTDAEDENQFLRMNYVLNFYSELSKYKDRRGRTISINSQLADVHKLAKNRFKEIEKKDKNKCYHALDGYVNSLIKMSCKFRDLLKPFEESAFQEIPEDKKQEIRSIAAQFLRLKTQSSVLPVLTAIYEVYSNDADKLLKLMLLCEKAVFRIYYIAGKPSYSGLDRFRSLANSIYRNRLKYEDTLRELEKTINEYCPNEKIREKLLDKENFYEWDGLHYFLYELERERCKVVAIDKKPHFEWDELKKWKREDTIEHILPQTIIEKDGTKVLYWTDRFDLKSHEKNHKRLGNMTLSYSNSKGGNKGFDKKKEIYEKSLWQITRDVAKDFADWDEGAIDKREKELVSFAKKRWGDASTS